MGRRRINIRNPLPFGGLYAALIGGAVMLQSGFFMCWFGSFIRFGRRGSYTTVRSACPEYYYFGLAALFVGLLILIPLLVLSAIRWIRGARFSLAELISAVLVMGFVMSFCMNGMLTRPGIASWFLVPLYGVFFDASKMSYVNDNFNAIVYVAAILVTLVFTIPLCGRLPEGSRIARYSLCALSIVIATGFGSPGWAQVFGFLSAVAMLLYGVADRSALTALFTRKNARASLLPHKPGVANVNASDKKGAAAKAGV